MTAYTFMAIAFCIVAFLEMKFKENPSGAVISLFFAFLTFLISF